MANEDHSWVVEGCVRSARRAFDAGDARALASAVAQMEVAAGRWGSEVQRQEVCALRSSLNHILVFEANHGAGSALNLSNPSVKRLIESGSYTDVEVRNAHAAIRFKSQACVDAPGGNPQHK